MLPLFLVCSCDCARCVMCVNSRTQGCCLFVVLLAWGRKCIVLLLDKWGMVIIVSENISARVSPVTPTLEPLSDHFLIRPLSILGRMEHIVDADRVDLTRVRLLSLSCSHLFILLLVFTCTRVCAHVYFSLSLSVCVSISMCLFVSLPLRKIPRQ